LDTEFRYDAIIFDVGGTLLGFHERAPFREFLAAIGLPAGDEEARSVHRRFMAVVVATRDSAEDWAPTSAAVRLVARDL